MFKVIIYTLLTVILLSCGGELVTTEEYRKTSGAKQELMEIAVGVSVYYSDRDFFSHAVTRADLYKYISINELDEIPENWADKNDFVDRWGNPYYLEIVSDGIIGWSFGPNGVNDYCLKDDVLLYKETNYLFRHEKN